MAKTRITVESDLDELVKDMLILAEDFPDVIAEAATEEMKVFESAIQRNWSTMVPWGKVGDYVYDSIGYNVAIAPGTNDVVGMAGVFLLDAVNTKHGKEKKDIKAPKLAYWAEFGFTPNNGKPHAGVPFMSNAFHATLAEREKVFADTLQLAINKRMNK
jgi:hypothetical protein